MPTIQCFIVDGGSDSDRQRLIAALTEAVVTAIAAPADSVRVILSEVGAGHFGVGGKAVVALHPAGAQAVMQAFLIAGRTAQQKERLIAALTACAALIGADPAAVRVIIVDVPNTDFGLGGQTAKALGRGVGRDAMH